MSEQDNNQLVHFILEQQAKLTSQMEWMRTDMERMRADDTERYLKSEKRLSEIEQAFVRSTNLANSLREEMNALAAAQKKQAEGMVEMQKSLASLAETQKKHEGEMAETRERLDAFILVLEEYIAENRQRRRSNGQNSGN